MWTSFFSQLMLDVERWVWLQSQPQEEGGSYDGPTHAIIRVVSVGHSGCPTYWGEMEAKGRAEHWRVRMVLVRPRGEAPTWGRRKQPPCTSLPSRRTWEEKSRSCSPHFSETKGTCHHCGPNVPLLRGHSWLQRVLFKSTAAQNRHKHCWIWDDGFNYLRVTCSSIKEIF